MDDINVPIFSQAKLEYTKQLVDILYMNMYDGIRSIYDDAKLLYLKKKEPITFVFRNLLEQVPKWNTEIIQYETERIEKSSKCDWLDDLLTAVFISHTRILMSIGPNQNFNKINVTIPKTTTFIHKSYINIAREVWKNPYLFDEHIPGHEYQRNMKQLEDMIKLTIEDTVRRQLPIKEILREHLENYDEPKQTKQQPLDMKMIINELKKANLSQNNKGDDDDIPDDEDDSDDIDNSKINNFEASTPIFNKEEDVINEESLDTPLDTPLDTSPTTQDINKEAIPVPIQNMNNQYINKSDITDNPIIFNTDDDPNEEQIKRATQNIVLNDITEPVVEEKYDNTYIIDENKNDSSINRLSTMVKELNINKNDEKPSIIKLDEKPSIIKLDEKPSIIKLDKKPIIKLDEKPIIKLDEKPIIKLDEKPSIIKIDEKPSIIKIDEKPSIIKIDEKPSIVKKEQEKKPLFSFDNLFENKKEQNDTDIKKTEIDKNLNADVMKEVISLDKKNEEIDDTQTLDNFFSDVQKLANPMTPIKEENKYTLFEDAPLNE